MGCAGNVSSSVVSTGRRERIVRRGDGLRRRLRLGRDVAEVAVAASSWHSAADGTIDVALHVTVVAGQVLVCAATIGEDRHADAALIGSGDGVEDVTIVVVTL